MPRTRLPGRRIAIALLAGFLGPSVIDRKPAPGPIEPHGSLPERPPPPPSPSSPSPPLRPGEWRSGARARALLEPWSGCAHVRALLAEPSDLDVDLQARTLLDGVEVSRYGAGGGRWAVFEEERIHLARGGCDPSIYSLQGGKESLIHGVRFVRAIDGASHAAVRAGAHRVIDPDSAELAAARILLGSQDAARAPVDGVPDQRPVVAAQSLLGPPLPVQPDHAGPPRGSPVALWTEEAIAAAGMATTWFEAEADGRLDAVLTQRVPDPVMLASRGRWQIWEVRFRARLGGGLLAVHDGRTDRTRWILGTEIDTPRSPQETPGSPPDHFDLLAFQDGLVLVRTHLDDSQSLWATDLERGLTRQVAPGQEVTFRRAGDDVIIRAMGGGTRRRIPLAELRP